MLILDNFKKLSTYIVDTAASLGSDSFKQELSVVISLDVSNSALPFIPDTTTFDLILKEISWYFGGGSNIADLHQHGLHFMDPWADNNGDLGMYIGEQLRMWPNEFGQKTDQLQLALKKLQSGAHPRDNVISFWNVGCLDLMNFKPNITQIQFVGQGDCVDMMVYMRSLDLFRHGPRNFGFLGLFLAILAAKANLCTRYLTCFVGDMQLYGSAAESIKKSDFRTGKLTVESVEKINFDRILESGLGYQ